jgi:hypothetical protein
MHSIQVTAAAGFPVRSRTAEPSARGRRGLGSGLLARWRSRGDARDQGAVVAPPRRELPVPFC